MASNVKRKPRMSMGDKIDKDVLAATSEAFRIEVDKAFHDFLADGSIREYSFSADLTVHQRKYIHQKCIIHHLTSRSHGKNPSRVLTIYKKGTKSNFESFYIDIVPETRNEVQRLLMQTPSHDSIYRGVHRLTSNDKVFGKLSLGPPPTVAPPNTPAHILAFQQKLPIYEMRQEVVERIRACDVLIITSETGSGKTTQIPQYIMDDAYKNGEPCRILCTQPRRISAVSVAERVSQERGVPIGERVGYHIRLESKLGTDCNLVYCTNGVLVRSLMSGDRVLNTLTHIIIDEVHERDKLSDFLLICLRESLRKGIKVKLILMSATIKIDKFRDYFNGAEMMTIPGRLFTIKQLFLDDVLELTGYDAVIMNTNKKAIALIDSSGVKEIKSAVNPVWDDIIEQCLNSAGSTNEQVWSQLLQYILMENMPVNYQHSGNGFTALMAAIYRDNVDMVEKLCSLGCDPSLVAKSGVTALSLAEEHHMDEIPLLLTMVANPQASSVNRDELLTQYYKTCADEDINFDLMIRLITTIHTQYQAGAILVFLPGYDDIMLCNDRILETDMDPTTYRVFFLHGAMNIKEQHEVFKHLPNLRKIILSTNIAETSLTIDDVVYVIDSGKAKIQTYDACSGLSSLQTQWISKACVKQRAGRAGRTQSGVCFHLFSKTRFDSFLEERIPEILRVPLEELCLNTKALVGNVTSIYDFLVLAPDPPSPSTVKTAIENLECLGAMDCDENLTPLGEYLSQLTIEPHLGKMLIYSVIFKCLDPILTIVASLAQKDPFQLPTQSHLRSSASEKRKSLMVNTYSDHMIYLKAFIKWQDAVRTRRERQFCREYFISPSTMDTILKTRSQLLCQLRAAKFIPINGGSMMSLNSFSENWPLIKAVISSGLYPKMAFKKNGQFCTRTEKKILIHNSSPLYKENIPLWLVYDDMVKIRHTHQIRGVTAVTPLTISLMGGIKATSPQPNYLTIDDWLEFEFPSTHMVHLRSYIDAIIERKLFSPANNLSEFQEATLATLARILVIEDRNVNLTIPMGIKQKPKFFEINRAVENGSFESEARGGYNAYYSNNSTVQNDYQSSSSTSNSYSYNQRNNGYGSSETYQWRSAGSLENNDNSFFSTSLVPVAQGTNGFHYTPGLISDMGASCSSVYLDEAGRSSVDLTRVSLLTALESLSNSSTPTFRLSPRWEESVFVLLRVKQGKSVEIAQETQRWVFAPQTEKQVVALDNGGMTVYLIFTVHLMNAFLGLAKYVSLDKSRQKPAANLEWIFKTSVPFKHVGHLRNCLNNNRLIYEGVDGQLLDIEAAMQLWKLFWENGRPLLKQS